MSLLHSITLPRSPLASIGAAVAIAVAGIATGLTSALYPEFAPLVAAGALLLTLALFDLSLVLVLAIPAVFVVTRVGPMSGADVALFAATIIAMLMLRGGGAEKLQPMLWAGALYVGLTAPQLILNPYAENVVEWVHQAVLVLGSLIVGFAIGRAGRARLALSIYVIICCAIAVAAIFTSVTNGFGAVYLGMWHKNAIGSFLMFGAVIAFANPPWLRWSPTIGYAAFALCGLGMLAAQSRQSLVGALVGVLIVGLRPRFHNGKRSRWIWFLLVPIAWFVYSEVVEQLATGDKFNSASQRLIWYGDSITVWLMSPLFGVGNRWWITGHTGYSGFQPPNAELEVLTTVGVLGLIGFLGMFGAAMWLLWRKDPVYGTLGLAIVAARFVQGQFDLYWVASHASLLWIVVGICYGVQEHDRLKGVVWTPHPVQTLFRRESFTPRRRTVGVYR
ncbi:hypothetical protein GCM10009775_10260 [Microbacterium aoyamense]|uniref:O-antigen ligase-related domain-containing protein n=1 Tax=Microbacterium aoyamense TaxID=344166 RepID=A0ABN2PEQ4_9MICO|nr:O-antigen ligase family protein [Microbacterium aoyamense]